MLDPGLKTASLTRGAAAGWTQSEIAERKAFVSKTKQVQGRCRHLLIRCFAISDECLPTGSSADQCARLLVAIQLLAKMWNNLESDYVKQKIVNDKLEVSTPVASYSVIHMFFRSGASFQEFLFGM